MKGCKSKIILKISNPDVINVRAFFALSIWANQKFKNICNL